MEAASAGIPARAPARPARFLRLASDERLVALVRTGDERAFEVLYDRHLPAILGFCRHMLGSREQAEDAVQQTFLAAYRDLVGSDKAILLRPWLFAIARNRCLSTLRARREHVSLDHVEPSTEGLAAQVERREDVRELLGDLAQLPEDQRAALLLAELGALDHEGIAGVLGCRREKVKALVFQARTSLAADREARATPCADIRAMLATAGGGELRRGLLRRHLRTCAGCRAFKGEVARQNRLLGIALPVVPTAALKAGVLTGIGGAGAVGGIGSATGGGMLAGLGGGVAAKVAAGVALAGSVAGGTLTVEAVRDGGDAPTVRSAPVQASPIAPPAPVGSAPARRETTPSSGTPGARPRRSPRAVPQARTDPPAGGGVTSVERRATAPGRNGTAGKRSRRPAAPPGRSRARSTPPAHGSTGSPPGQAKAPGRPAELPGNGNGPPAGKGPPEHPGPPAGG